MADHGILVILFLVIEWTVAPMVREVYRDYRAKLPGPTWLACELGEFLRSPFGLLLIMVVLPLAMRLDWKAYHSIQSRFGPAASRFYSGAIAFVLHVPLVLCLWALTRPYWFWFGGSDGVFLLLLTAPFIEWMWIVWVRMLRLLSNRRRSSANDDTVHPMADPSEGGAWTPRGLLTSLLPEAAAVAPLIKSRPMRNAARVVGAFVLILILFELGMPFLLASLAGIWVFLLVSPG